MPDKELKEDPNQIKISDENLRGVYANAMQIAHTREEFVLDFMNLFPPQGVVTARVITSPGHLKRIIAALNDNLEKYEREHGEIQASSASPEMNLSVN